MPVAEASKGERYGDTAGRGMFLGERGTGATAAEATANTAARPTARMPHRRKVDFRLLDGWGTGIPVVVRDVWGATSQPGPLHSLHLLQPDWRSVTKKQAGESGS